MKMFRILYDVFLKSVAWLSVLLGFAIIGVLWTLNVA